MEGKVRCHRGKILGQGILRISSASVENASVGRSFRRLLAISELSYRTFSCGGKGWRR